ncbi:uncharacterized protein LOC126734614 isoform X2 [Anthonomus grandis grandis]|uniref:uncharacterized protein LOC126734614 isoform X2 n=1 Tax=Anthonomus grandis grandis TaxID=2921223 RepID=UPI002165FCF9|nr:uncharacterized protein LOC126734614 isoform X2 [Anthonomus grandis grandis]
MIYYLYLVPYILCIGNIFNTQFLLIPIFLSKVALGMELPTNGDNEAENAKKSVTKEEEELGQNITRINSSEIILTSTTLMKTTETNKSTESALEKDEHSWWLKDAIKEIAYYLRAHKFNEFDRRYNRNGTNVERTNFKHFPIPPLRALHWEVNKYCKPSFLECVDYLRKKVKHVALRRQDDTSIAAQENNWGANASRMISQVDLECKRMMKIDYDVAPPFEGPLERYQWRVTASYFMCWYTMNEIPDLKYLDEQCDNFAYCLHLSYGPNNEDVRAVDKVPFKCAEYSFCPDPCCQVIHLPRIDVCWNNVKNPCFKENPEGKRECQFKRNENTDFTDLILNRWNVSCHCQEKGYIWNSLYGLCVDIDECSDEVHTCNKEGQACINLPGSYKCICRWGYFFDNSKKTCVVSNVIDKIKLNSEPKKNTSNGREAWIIAKKIVLTIINVPYTSSGSQILLSNLLNGYFIVLIIYYDSLLIFKDFD